MIFLLILISFLVVLLVIFLVLIVNYLYDMNSLCLISDKYRCIMELPKIKYKYFINMYKINKKKYILNDEFVKIYGKDVAFSFSFFDYYRYVLFRREESKAKEEEYRDIERQRMLKSIIQEVEKDIETYKKKSKDEIEQAREITERIMKGG